MKKILSNMLVKRAAHIVNEKSYLGTITCCNKNLDVHWLLFSDESKKYLKRDDFHETDIITEE